MPRAWTISVWAAGKQAQKGFRRPDMAFLRITGIVKLTSVGFIEV
jgi:hypothetical protein